MSDPSSSRKPPHSQDESLSGGKPSQGKGASGLGGGTSSQTGKGDSSLSGGKPSQTRKRPSLEDLGAQDLKRQGITPEEHEGLREYEARQKALAKNPPEPKNPPLWAQMEKTRDKWRKVDQ